MEVLSKDKTLLSSPDVEVKVEFLNNTECLVFEFRGHFSREVCENATKAWKNYFDEQMKNEFVIVWDCLQMDGFDYDAKNEWAETLSKYADRIRTINVISSSVLIRGAARLMGKFSKYDLRVFKSYEEFGN
ncbi:MAG: hypothetical protein RIM99_10430 [Cyclobacteriaceae bacterium]